MAGARKSSFLNKDESRRLKEIMLAKCAVPTCWNLAVKIGKITQRQLCLSHMNMDGTQKLEHMLDGSYISPSRTWSKSRRRSFTDKWLPSLKE
jgi:hypothetical protein